MKLLLAAWLCLWSFPFAFGEERLQELTKIRALTYNVGLLRILNYPVVPLYESREEVLASTLSRAVENHSWDVVALEELWEEPIAYRARYALEKLGYHTFHSADRRMYGAGLVLAVRAPWRVTSLEHIPFERVASAELFTLKSFILAKLVHQNGQELILVHAHMQAIQFTDDGLPVRSYEADVHRSQADQILREVDRLQPQGRRLPVMLLGDLNVGVNAGPESFSYMTNQQGWMGADVGGILNTWDDQNPLVKASKVANKTASAIDHCLYRNGSQSSFTDLTRVMKFSERLSGLELYGEPIPLSDHYGLECEASFSAGF